MDLAELVRVIRGADRLASVDDVMRAEEVLRSLENNDDVLPSLVS